MIDPIRRTRVVPLSEPLPACWLRRNPTTPDTDDHARVVFRVGPGGRLRQALVDTVDEAAEVVLVASFLLSDEALADALLRASERGRRVYVLTASDEKLSKLVPDEDVFEARMVAEHKRLLDRLAGKVLLRSADHFHAKLLVTDPQTKPRGWISTANFNRALLDSVELGVRLRPECAAAVAGWFAYVFWAEAERELAAKGRLAKVREPPGTPLIPEAGDVVVTTRQHATLRAEVLRLVESARRELLIASYGLDSAHPVVEAIAAKAKAGVEVTVLTRPRPAVRDAALRLVEAGARVVGHDKLHGKAIVSEAGAMVMSANLEPAGLDAGFEVGVVLDEAGQDELRHILGEWADRFPWRFASSPNRTEHLGEICLADRGLRDGRRKVIEEKLVHLPSITADDALHLDDAPEPELRPPEMADFPQRLRFEWEVRPPHLPRGAKERMREVDREERAKGGKVKKIKTRVPHDPPLYEHRGQVFVVLRDTDRVDRVEAVAAELGARVVLP